jgi:hypothetical protein
MKEAPMTPMLKDTFRPMPSRAVTEAGLSPRRFAGIVTAGAVAMALVLGAALPAKADKKNDLAKALIGALVVGVIVNELTDKPKPQSAPLPVKAPRVPSVCAISIDGAERSVTLYAESCMRAEGLDQRLPRACANTARIFGREDRVYGVQCLRDAGFQVAGR